MSLIDDFDTLSPQEIADQLNSDNSLLDQLTPEQIVSLITTNKDVIVLLNEDTQENFSTLLENSDLSGLVDGANIVNLLNDVDLKSLIPSLERIKEIANISDLKIVEDFLNKNPLDGLGSLIGTVSILALIPTALSDLDSLSNSFPQSLNQAFEEFYEDLKTLSNSIKDFPVKAFEDLFDSGFGFDNATGGTNNSGNYVSYDEKVLTDPEGTTNAESTSIKIEKLLNAALTKQDWKAKNATPGNPLILEAYALSGRNYEKDGLTGEYNWNAAFVNWILARAGASFPKSMSALAYLKYGNPVDFGTFKKVRRNDLIVFKSINGVAVVGFVRSYDSKKKEITVLVGNTKGTVSEVKVPFSRTSPALMTATVRRNWTPIPDTPLIVIETNTRPSMQTGRGTVVETLNERTDFAQSVLKSKSTVKTSVAKVSGR